MTTPAQMRSLDEQIAQWRSYLGRRQAIHTVDVAELEDHLREQITGLVAAGLAADEAFLVAVKRMGELDAVSREFAREHSERLWKQLVMSPAGGAERQAAARQDGIVAFAFAVAAGAAIKIPMFLGVDVDSNESFYFRNMSLFVLPLLTAYFVWKRKLSGTVVRWLAVAFVAAAVAINAIPFTPQGSTEVLSALHLPIALWLAVGIAYAGGRWNQVTGRMDLVRFSGELFIYYVLIALGGGVLTGFMALIFKSIGVNIEPLMGTWIVPCGAAGGVLVASWLVEAKQSVIENMAPVLTRLFTPLFATVLVAFLGTVLFTGRGVDVQREVLIAFDALLAVVVGLLLYSVSARDPEAPPGPFDLMQVILVIAALLANTVALWAMAGRISELGSTPNRVAALGENVILLVNLAWSAVLYLRFLRRRGTIAPLEKWQTDYLPVYAAWAAVVVLVFPVVFGYK